MGGNFTARVVAEQPRTDVHAGEPETVHRETCNFQVIETGANGHAGVVVPFLDQLLESFAILRRYFHQHRQVVDDTSHVIDQARHDLQGVGREIVGQHHPIAVQNQAAIGHHGHHQNAVLLGERVVIVVLDDLHVEESQEQNGKSDQHGATNNGQAQLEEVQVALMIPKFDRAVHGPSNASGRI